MKEHADKCSHAKSADLNVGDRVLVKQPKKSKMSTPFNPEPFEIKEKKGSMITAQNADPTVTINASFFKKLPSNIQVHPVPSDEEDQSSPFIEAAEAVEPVGPAGPAGPPAVVHVPVEPDELPAVAPVEPVEPVEPSALRRSARTRRVPEHVKDFVT